MVPFLSPLQKFVGLFPGCVLPRGFQVWSSNVSTFVLVQPPHHCVILPTLRSSPVPAAVGKHPRANQCLRLSPTRPSGTCARQSLRPLHQRCGSGAAFQAGKMAEPFLLAPPASQVQFTTQAVSAPSFGNHMQMSLWWTVVRLHSGPRNIRQHLGDHCEVASQLRQLLAQPTSCYLSLHACLPAAAYLHAAAERRWQSPGAALASAPCNGGSLCASSTARRCFSDASDLCCLE